MKIKFILFVVVLSIVSSAFTQTLKPGFSKSEYIELLCLTAKHTDPDHFEGIPIPEKFELDYRSPIVALDNAWELWTSADNKAAISIRGTTENTVSWLANFYAAMVPATGKLNLSATDTFHYALSENPRAAVHVGWLVATAFLSKTILPKIDSCYASGIKDIYLIGHSQGGGICFLMTAYLYSLQKEGRLPADIQFKTYCSAGPKPGNLFFAYEYENITQTGWSYNVVNANDWVPEVPFSIQTTDDFTEVNPFRLAKGMIKQQKFPKNVALNHVYKKLDKPSRKAQNNYQKYLGDLMSEYVIKNIPEFEAPLYVESNNYVRTGNTIVLMGDSAYFKIYPLDKEKIFQHHLPAPYLYLANKLPENNSDAELQVEKVKLNGNWVLFYISGKKISFDGLYPIKKPTILFDLNASRVSGNTSCNSFSSSLQIEDGNMLFGDLITTKMFCEGEGEQSFLETFQRVNKYNISNTGELLLMEGEIVLMKFNKKQ